VSLTQAQLDGSAFVLAGNAFDPSPPGFAGTETATLPIFGAPGPQGKASPIERNYNTQFIRSLFDTGSAASVSPNIERNSQIICGGSPCDLILRFTYNNQTTITHNNLRVLWIDILGINLANLNFTATIDTL